MSWKYFISAAFLASALHSDPSTKDDPREECINDEEEKQQQLIDGKISEILERLNSMIENNYNKKTCEKVRKKVLAFQQGLKQQTLEERIYFLKKLERFLMRMMPENKKSQDNLSQ